MARLCKLAAGGGLAALAYTQLPVQTKWDIHARLSDTATTALRQIDAETAHNLAIKAASLRLTPVAPETDPVLHTNLLGLGFPSPVGLAAGFDKNAEGITGLLDMGFGFVEIGTVTPVGQAGNEKPRMWRLPEDRGVINRYGFNNGGMEEVYPRVASAQKHGKPLGINVGKNKVTSEAEAVSDYSKCIRKLGPHADYLVVNVSSPNTPGLRDLQKKDVLQKLLASLVEVRNELSHRPAILVKVAPDLSTSEIKDIASASLGSKVDGVIVSNTTISRPDTLQSENKDKAGGLSGAPLRDLATATVGEMYKQLDGKLPIIGVGGVGSGADAYEKIRAGASLVQLYSLYVHVFAHSLQNSCHTQTGWPTRVLRFPTV